MTTTVLLLVPTDATPDHLAVDLAQLMLRRGCRVVVIGTDVAVLLDAVRGYGAARAAAVVGDHRDPAARTALVTTAQACFGSVDLVVDPMGEAHDDTAPQVAALAA
ncbi:hypothetical protein ACQ7HM_08795 [Williamsia sp. MIQD14]|uniref:hypothetical protein n=1 Tax=Williamsia sp. MIQD14 TaxID=3425703 RepID=UPI003DA0F850